MFEVIFWSVNYDQDRATELGDWPKGQIHEDSLLFGKGERSCILGLMGTICLRLDYT